MISTVVSNSIRAALYPFSAARRAALAPRGTWITLTLEGSVTEIERPFSRFSHPLQIILKGGPPKPVLTLAVLRELAEAAAADPNVDGLLLRIEALECGSAVATGLREVILGLRAAGKKVVAWLPEGASTREYFVALAADKVLLTPQSSLGPLGYAAQTTFVRALLERGGLETEVYARKEFKSAAEQFSRDGYSEPNRKQLEALLDRLHAALVAALAEGRRVDENRARAMVESSPYRAADAVREGLVDAVAYEDELPGHLTGASGAKPKLVKAAMYFALSRVMRFDGMWDGPRVGIVEVRGAIVSASRSSMSGVADARRVGSAIRAARANPRVGAVVLYVDSRGGSALGSDMIAHEVERLKEKKPVVAYFSDVAASGGYYVAALAQEIIAQPLTITGSIGVIAMRLLASRLLEKLGVNHEVIRRGERADMLSPFRGWSDDERAAFNREIDGSYNDFVGIVARGRGRDVGEVEPLARGRVYAGADAHALGLVDHLGGLDVAIARARSLASTKLADRPVVITPPRGTVDPPEPAPAVQALLGFLEAQTVGSRAEVDLLRMSLASPNERLFAWDGLSAGL
jgi:protease IV